MQTQLRWLCVVEIEVKAARPLRTKLLTKGGHDIPGRQLGYSEPQAIFLSRGRFQTSHADTETNNRVIRSAIQLYFQASAYDRFYPAMLDSKLTRSTW
jgi:hypothetical protein